ncbi:MAG: CobW family GTP-binding protein [Polaromonas sp.]|jgi:G3E family GTPase
MIAFDLLTGFLGSGKTTLLNAFLRTETGQDTAVIVNEFGAIGLDQLQYKELSEDVYLLDNGCLCCTVTHSLRETLLEIKDLTHRLGRPALKRVVIETTGLADPLPVMHALLGDKSLMRHFRLGQVIATVDAVQGLQQLQAHLESRKQACVAEHLVITKIDMTQPQALIELKQRLLQLNPYAQITESVAGQAAANVFTTDLNKNSFKLLPRPLNDQLAEPSHGADIGSWSVYTDICPTWAGIAAWWHLITLKFGRQLLRCKGLLRVNDVKPFVLIQGVGKVFHSPSCLQTWPDADPRGRIVCIGQNLDAKWLQASLKALTLTDSVCRPRTLEELDECLSTTVFE